MPRLFSCSTFRPKAVGPSPSWKNTKLPISILTLMSPKRAYGPIGRQANGAALGLSYLLGPGAGVQCRCLLTDPSPAAGRYFAPTIAPSTPHPLHPLHPLTALSLAHQSC